MPDREPCRNRLGTGGRRGTESGAATACRSRSLPDPFARAIRRAANGEAERPTSCREAGAAAGRSFSIRSPALISHHPDLAGHHRASVASARAAPDPALLLLSDDGHPIALPRRDQGSAGRRHQAQPADPRRLRGDRGPALLPPLGHRSARHRPGDGRQPARRRRPRRAEARSPSSSPRPTSCRATAPIKRKAQEVIIAFWLEAWLTKQEILSRYLSSVYFGDGVYGLRAAAHHYFNRDPEKLTLAQSAMLAGHGAGAVAARADAASRGRPEAQPAGACRRWPTPARSAQRARASGSARRGRSRSSPSYPTGTYFADWVAPYAQQAFEVRFRRGEGPRRRSTRDLQRLAVRAVGRRADRRRAGGAGRDAARRAGRRDGRRQELRATRPSTASPRRGASPARRSSCSSISPRCAPAGRPTA